MCAGAFAMAAGEYVSVRSQRELFEYQIGLERDELAAVSRGRGAGARADLRGEGPAARRRPRGSRSRSSPIPSTRSTRSRARSSASIPDELGSPWGAAISSFLSFAAGALLPLVAVRRRAGRRARCRSRSASPRVALFAVGALLSLFTGRSALLLGRAHAGAGRARGRRHLSRSAASPVSRLADARAGACASLTLEARAARSRCAQRHPVDLLRRDRRASTARPRPATRSPCVAPTARSLAPRRVLAVVADPRARLDASTPRERDRRGVLRAQRVARAVAARAPMLDARHTGVPAGARRVGRPARASSPTATATSSSCSSRRPAPSAGATRSSRRSPRATGVALRLRALRRRGAHARRACRRATGVAARRAARAGDASSRTASPTASTSSPGQKTGFYLDQRDNRARRARARRAAATCSTCSATPAASRWRRSPAARRASLSIDSSADALALARENLARNPALAAERAKWLEADAFAELRKLRDARRAFDLDRPRSAEVRADRRARRARGARVQGHQPAGAEAAAPGRPARDVLVLGRHRRRAVPEDRRRRGARRGRRRADRRPLRRERRPSGRARVSRRRLPEGPADPQGRRDGRDGPRRCRPVCSRTKTRPQPVRPAAALSASAGWTGGHPAVFGNSLRASASAPSGTRS